jgi:tetratricopeptide (TPR) repeat protein
LEQEVWQAKAEYDKGVAYYKQFQFEQATAHFQQALDKAKVSSFYLSLGNSQFYLIQYYASLQNIKTALILAHQKGNKNIVGTSFNNIGMIYDFWGNYDKAVEYYNKSLNIRQEVINIPGEALTRNNLARIHAQHGILG